MALNDIIVPKENSGGTFDEVVLAPSSIGAQSLFDASTQNITANTTLAAARARKYTIQNYDGNTYNVTLPTAGVQSGDIAIVLAGTLVGSQNIRKDIGGGNFLTIATISNDQSYRFVYTSNSWSIDPVYTHTHPASAISDSTTAGRALLTGADAAAQRTSLGLGTAATSATGDFAAASHSHGNINSSGQVGSDSGRVLVTTTAGAVTTLALGTANQVLRTKSDLSGVEFADPAAAGVTGAAASASDVLGVSGANITGVDANADRIVFWDDSASKLAYLEAGSGLSISGTTLSATSSFNPASPGAIGGTTPSTGAFTSLSTAPAANTAALTTTGYSLTGTNAQSLVDLAGTWNTTGTPSAFKLNVTDTASNASSLLMQLQTGGTNRFTVNKTGGATASSFTVSNGDFTSNGFPVLRHAGTELLAFATNSQVHINVNGAYSIGWATSGPTATDADCRMWRDAANTWALRNGVNAQESRLYGTYSSASNYQRMTIKSVKQTLSALSGASATTTGTFIPDGAVVVGVTTRVATALTGAAGYTIGDGTDADRWGDITGTAIGTTSDNANWTAGTVECFTAGGNVTLTAKTSNFTAGAIEICVFYLAGQAD